MSTYSQTLDLESYRYYIDTEINNTTYFTLSLLPDILGYGKHPFIITYNPPEDLPPLQSGANLLFEFVDSKGVVIYSEITTALSGGGIGYVWVKKNPLRTSAEIADGMAKFYIVSSLDSQYTPGEFDDAYNIRSTFEYEIRKDYQNTSPILFPTPTLLQSGFEINQSIEFDTGDTHVSRSYVNVSASHLQTNGGQARFAELSYKESNTQATEYTTLSTYEISGSNYEVPVDDSAGLNILSHQYKVPVPNDFRRNTPVVFRLRIKNPNGDIAQYYTGSLLNTDIEITSSEQTFTGSALFIEGNDNLISGSLYTGDAVGDGFEMAARDGGAYLKSKEYTGFSNGNTGVMLFSGSVLPTATDDDYKGVGLELYGSANSFLKFRSIPSELDIRTDKFFVGNTTTQFISGANNNIEISSSDFHLDPNNDTLVIGANATINAGLTVNSLRTPATIGGVASTEQNSSSSIDSKGFARFVSASIGSFGVSDNAFFSPPDEPVTPNFYISGAATGTEYFISSSNFQVKADGTIEASAGVIGSGVTIDADLTANAIRTPALIGGVASTATNASSSIDSKGFASFKSASIAGFVINPIAIVSTDGNLVLSSSGKITASAAKIDGDITATKGSFGGITIDSTGINSDSHELSITGSTGQITASAAKISGNITATTGQIGGITIKNAGIHSDSHQLSITGSTGQITASAAKLTTADISGKITADEGSIGGITIKSQGIHSDSHQLSITGSTGQITASAAKLTSADISGKITANEGSIGGWTVDSNAIYIGTEVADDTFTSAGHITLGAGFLGSNQFKIAADGAATFKGSITGGSIEIGTNAWSVDSSGNMWWGNDADYSTAVSNGGITISSAGAVNFTSGVFSGDLTGATGTFSANIKIGDKATFAADGNDGVFISSDGISLGDENEFQVTNAGSLTAKAGTIANWNIRTSDIYSGTDSDYIQLGSTGIQLGDSTFGDAPFSVTNAGVLKSTSGTIGGWTIGSTLSATNILLDPTTPKITLGSKATLTDSNTGLYLGTDGIALGASSVFKVTSAGVLTSTSGTIGGWTLGSETIVGSNLTLRSSGIIETNDFASGVKGFRLDSAGNGSAEFENITIRGTLSTTVFEKETVNAVGGQLYVGNSTTITGSTQLASTATTMSVANIGGFVANEIISAKKVTDTGFSTEYMLVESSSRNNPESGTDIGGKLYVKRGYSGSLPGTNDTSSLGDSASIATTYEPGQVIVSTGKEGTGFIRLNANPNDSTTPYIDVVERTGSAIYDIQLKTRLGDLSGLSQEKLHGTNPANAGFGLYGENVFLQGGIVANTGSIGGIKMQSNKLFTGAGTFGTADTGVYLDSSGQFSLKDKFKWDNSTLTITGSLAISDGDVSKSLASINTTTQSINLGITSLNNTTGSHNARISAIEITTGSINLSVSSLNESTASVGQTTGSLNATTASLQNSITSQDSRISSIELTTGSINLSVSALESTTTSLNTETGSLQSSITTQDARLAEIELTTGSINLSVSAIETATASLNTTTGSLNTSIATQNQRLADIELTTGSINLSVSAIESATASLNTTTGSLNTSIATQNQRLADIELTTGSINLSVSAIESATASLNTTTGSLNDSITTQNQRLAEIELTTGSINLSVEAIKQTTGSQDQRLSQIELETGSINLSVSSINDTTGSQSDRLSQIELTTGSIELSVEAIKQTTGSQDQRLSQIEIETGSINLNVSSIHQTTSSQDNRLSQIELETGSINLSVASINQETGSQDQRLSQIELTTGSINLSVESIKQTTGSQDNRLSQIELETGSINLSVSSINDTTGSQDQRLSQIELETGSINLSVASINQETGSQDQRLSQIELTTGSINLSVSAIEATTSSLNTATGSQNQRLSEIELETGSINLSVSSINDTTGSQDQRLSQIELTTGSIELSVTALNNDSSSNLTALNINQAGVQISGSKLEFSGSTFVFGNKGAVGSQFISGSDGELEISSSTFALKGGAITASAGVIGGFLINSTQIKASGSSTDFLLTSGVNGSSDTSGDVDVTMIGTSQREFDGTIVKAEYTGSTTDTSDSGVAQLIVILDGVDQTPVNIVGSDNNTNEIEREDTTNYSYTAGQTVGAKIRFPDQSSGTFAINEMTVRLTLNEVSSPEQNGIVIDSSVPSISLGSGSFGETGIQLEVSKSITKAHIGELTGSHLRYDEGGFDISSSKFYFGSSTGTYISGSNGNLKIQSDKFTLAQNGDVTIEGQVSASSGDIGGINISSNQISAGSFSLTNGGILTAVGADLAGTISASAGNIGGLKLEEGKLSAGAGGGDVFSITGSTGQLTASNALIQGRLTAESINATGSGVIGGFDISGTQINDTGNNLILKSNGQITASAAQLSGDLIANNISADSGSIGGWILGDSAISKSFGAGLTQSIALTSSADNMVGLEFKDNDTSQLRVGANFEFSTLPDTSEPLTNLSFERPGAGASYPIIDNVSSWTIDTPTVRNAADDGVYSLNNPSIGGLGTVSSSYVVGRNDLDYQLISEDYADTPANKSMTNEDRRFQRASDVTPFGDNFLAVSASFNNDIKDGTSALGFSFKTTLTQQSSTSQTLEPGSSITFGGSYLIPDLLYNDYVFQNHFGKTLSGVSITPGVSTSWQNRTIGMTFRIILQLKIGSDVVAQRTAFSYSYEHPTRTFTHEDWNKWHNFSSNYTNNTNSDKTGNVSLVLINELIGGRATTFDQNNSGERYDNAYHGMGLGYNPVTTNQDLLGEFFTPIVLFDNFSVVVGSKPVVEVSPEGINAQLNRGEFFKFTRDGLELATNRSVSFTQVNPKAVLFDVSASNADGINLNPQISFNSSHTSSFSSPNTISLKGQGAFASSSATDTKVGRGGDIIIAAGDGANTGATGITAGVGGDLYLRSGDRGLHSDGGTSGTPGNIYITGSIFSSGSVTIDGKYTIPNTTGTSGDVLKWPSSGTTLEWGAGGSGGSGGTITALNNQTENRLVTIGSTTTELDGEANLTFDGSTLTVTGDIDPGASATHDLGSTTLRWRNVYTTDLQLSNMDREEGNKVDGTKGDWTLQEGKDDLYVINNLTGKKFKISLTPVDED